MNPRTLLVPLLAFGLWINVGCAQNDRSAAGQAKKSEAVCMIHPTTTGSAKGTVRFTPTADGKVKVVAHIEGLKPNQKHGFHIHEGTECGPDGMKAGGHFNPDGHDHAGPETAERHAGDFGNLTADAKGVAHLELTVDNISVGGAKPNNVVGRAMIVHANPDDLKTQPTGNAGGRIGCGIIKMAGEEGHEGHTPEKK